MNKDARKDTRKDAQRVVAKNRAATFHYTISDTFEAGLVLLGSEVKSIREGRVDISEAYASVERGEVWLRNLYVSGYFAATAFPHAERGARKLLLHAREVKVIDRAISREGFTLVPLDLHFSGGRVKVSLGIGRGKKVHDKRRVLAQRTEEKEALHAMRVRRDETRSSG
jgi:SsrA-binding protein